MSIYTLDKGLGAELPFIGLIIMAMVFGSTTFPIQSFFASNTETNINDLNRISTAQTSAELYFYNHVPTAAIYSTYQTSYDLGQEGGGSDIDWNTETFNDMKSGDYDGPPAPIPDIDCNSLLDNIDCNLDENTTKYLQQNYMDEDTSGRCTRPEYNLATYFQQNGTSLTGFTYAYSPIETTCSFTDGEVSYKAPNSFIAQKFDVPGNRYITMAEEANRTLYELHGNWADEVDQYYTSSETKCDTKDYATAESDAVSDAESDITSAFSDAPSSSIYSDIVFDTKKITGPSTTFSEGTNTDKFDGSDSQSYSDVGDCNCHPDHAEDATGSHCHDDEYKATVNVTVEKSNVKLVLKDEYSKLPVESGKEYLEFVVDEYEHDYHND